MSARSDELECPCTLALECTATFALFWGWGKVRKNPSNGSSATEKRFTEEEAAEACPGRKTLKTFTRMPTTTRNWNVAARSTKTGSVGTSTNFSASRGSRNAVRSGAWSSGVFLGAAVACSVTAGGVTENWRTPTNWSTIRSTGASGAATSSNPMPACRSTLPAAAPRRGVSAAPELQARRRREVLGGCSSGGKSHLAHGEVHLVLLLPGPGNLLTS